MCTYVQQARGLRLDLPGPTLGQRGRQEAILGDMWARGRVRELASALGKRHVAERDGMSVVKLRTKRSQVRVLPGVPPETRSATGKTAEG